MSPRATKKSAERAGADGAPARSRGRPRNPDADRAILTAALALLAQAGLERMSMDAVAERAGVSKATIYRRWPSKSDLAVEAVMQLRPPAPPPDQGSLLGDLAALMQAQTSRLHGTNVPFVVPRLLAEAMADEKLHALLVERGIDPVRAVLGTLVERAVERGELPADTDVELCVDVIHGTAVYRMILERGDPSTMASRLPGLVKLLAQKG